MHLPESHSSDSAQQNRPSPSQCLHRGEVIDRKSAGAVTVALFLLMSCGGIALAQEHRWTVYGEPMTGYGTFGDAMASEGDVDGDGVWDVIIGNWNHETGGASGAAWVCSGKDGALLHRLESYQGGRFGWSVAILPDIDGDGHAEFLVGDPYDDAGSVDGGAVAVYSGADASLMWSLAGSSSEKLGQTAVLVADYDQDGLRDAAIAAQGNWTIGLSSHIRVVSSATGTEITTLYSPSDYEGTFGNAIAHLDDVNADGTPDLIVGDSSDFTYSDDDGSAGAAFVFSGADWSVIHQLYGYSSESFGEAVACLGDLDGDGVSDFIVGAPTVDFHVPHAGEVDIYSGSDASLIYSINGYAWEAHFGTSVDGAGDMNDDGYGDFYVGQPYNYGGPGIMWLFSGRDGQYLYHLRDDSAGGGGDELGQTCLNVGDIDLDGRQDFAVAAAGVDTNGNNAGSVTAYASNDWYLDVGYRYMQANYRYKVAMGQSVPGNVAALFLVEVNGTPTTCLLAIGSCDSNGRFVLSGYVPAGLAGTSIDLLSFGIGSGGKIIDSVTEWIEFQ